MYQTNSLKKKKATLSLWCTLVVVIAFAVIHFFWAVYIQSFDSGRDRNIPSNKLLIQPSIDIFTKKQQHKTKKKQRPLKTKSTTKKRRSPQEIYHDCFKANPSIILNDITQTAHQKHLPYPLLHLGFPKTGTTSLYKLFKNSHIPSTHHSCRPYGKCGLCMRRAIVDRNGPPLHTCAGSNSSRMLFAQMEFTGNRNGTIDDEYCYWPQFQALDAIHRERPKATFLLLFREDIDKWINSVWRWNNLPYRIANCTAVFDSKGGEVTKDDMKDFFCKHVTRVRRFVADHPSHALVEATIDDPTTGERLAELFEGVNASHWGRENKGPKRVGLVRMMGKINRDKRRRDALKT